MINVVSMFVELKLCKMRNNSRLTFGDFLRVYVLICTDMGYLVLISKCEVGL